MTELVINAPHLQSTGQRMSTLALLVFGWLLWAYFSFPFVTLCGWFLDIRVCSEWVNLSGGYLSLQELLYVYGKTIASLVAVWCAWALYNGARRQRRRNRSIEQVPVSLPELSRSFGVEESELHHCRLSRFTTVQFDSVGRIVGMQIDSAFI